MSRKLKGYCTGKRREKSKFSLLKKPMSLKKRRLTRIRKNRFAFRRIKQKNLDNTGLV
jgi:hypothetical protein